MSLFNFIFVKDPHFDWEGHASRRDNYLQSLYAKFDDIGRQAKERNADALLIPGDIFLRTEPKSIAHELVSSMCLYFKYFPVPIYGILGNHDVRRGLQHYDIYPIKTLVETGFYKRVDDVPLILEKQGIKVKVSGVSFQRDALDLVKNYKKEDEDILILLAHFFLGEYNGKFFKEDVHGLDEFKDADFDILAVGHEHVNRAIYEKHGKFFVDTGQVVRVTANKHDKELQPTAVHIQIDADKKINISTFPVKHLPAETVFGVETAYEWEEEVDDWDEFADAVNSDRIFNFNRTIDLEQMIREYDGFTDEVKERVIEYVVAE